MQISRQQEEIVPLGLVWASGTPKPIPSDTLPNSVTSCEPFVGHFHSDFHTWFSLIIQTKPFALFCYCWKRKGDWTAYQFSCLSHHSWLLRPFNLSLISAFGVYSVSVVRDLFSTSWMSRPAASVSTSHVPSGPVLMPTSALSLPE